MLGPHAWPCVVAVGARTIPGNLAYVVVGAEIRPAPRAGRYVTLKLPFIMLEWGSQTYV